MEANLNILGTGAGLKIDPKNITDAYIALRKEFDEQGNKELANIVNSFTCQNEFHIKFKTTSGMSDNDVLKWVEKYARHILEYGKDNIIREYSLLNIYTIILNNAPYETKDYTKSIIKKLYKKKSVVFTDDHYDRFKTLYNELCVKLPKDYSQHKVIAFMGKTGAGKSSLISKISNKVVKIGHNMESCTKDIEVIDFIEQNDNILLIDTPGFDDSDISDTDILVKIAAWMESSFRNGQRLNGLIYLHEISDTKMTNSSKRNLRLFKKLCGEECFKNILIITTKWSDISKQKGEDRESELKDNYWKDMIANGASYFRYEDIEDTTVIDTVLHLMSKDKVDLKIQKQLVLEGKPLSQTDVGVDFMLEVNKLHDKYIEDLNIVKDDILVAIRHGDQELREELEERRIETENKLHLIQERLDLLANYNLIEKDFNGDLNEFLSLKFIPRVCKINFQLPNMSMSINKFGIFNLSSDFISISQLKTRINKFKSISVVTEAKIVYEPNVTIINSLVINLVPDNINRLSHFITTQPANLFSVEGINKAQLLRLNSHIHPDISSIKLSIDIDNTNISKSTTKKFTINVTDIFISFEIIR